MLPCAADNCLAGSHQHKQNQAALLHEITIALGEPWGGG
jgi:hypothetical protein